MSLLNEMLRDLEKRRTREERGVADNQAPVVAETGSSKKIFLAGGIVLFAGIIWLGSITLPDMFPEPPAVPTFSAPQKIVPAVVAGAVAIQPADTIEVLSPSPVEVSTPDSKLVVSEKPPAELLDLQIVEAEDSAQLSFSFAQLPEYRLLQNSSGAACLEVSFSQTQIGADFVIPPLTGDLLKQVSLVPQQQTLQLLVDLADGAEVESYQLLDGAEQGYRLLIKIVATPAIKTKSQRLAVLESKPAAVEETEVLSPAKVSKKQNRRSQDQTLYQAGLEQLQQGDLVAAEASFNQALLLDPKFKAARLQLVGLLQQQMELAQAEDLLQQGLLLTPESPDLRKSYAHLLLHNQRQGEAISLLKTDPAPTVAQDLEYYALLAALLQDTQQFTEAGSVYSQLLQVRPQVALWWMGMGIALEHSDDLERARAAYQEALSLPGLQPALQNYVQSRLQVLSTK